MQPQPKPPVPLSFGLDPHSELSLDGGRCVRVVPPASSQFFRSFVESQANSQVVERGIFIPSEVVDSSDEQELTIEHPEISRVLYPYEWTPSMLRDAALMLLDVVESLEESGYTLKDGHPWNILFEGAKPVWVDLTSVGTTEAHGPFPARASFIDYFMGPLRMFGAGLAPMARQALTHYLGPPSVWLNDQMALDAGLAFSGGRRMGMMYAAKAFFKATQYKIRSRFSSFDPYEIPTSIPDLRKFVSNMPVEPQQGAWSDYYCGKNELPEFDPSNLDFKDTIDKTSKHQQIHSILKEQQPQTLLDIGCNTGLYSFIAESLGIEVLGLDTDEMAADRMYSAAKAHGRNVTTGCVDFVTPLRAVEYLHRPRVRPLHERVEADAVLCLAVVHHLVFKRKQLSFPDIVGILGGVARRLLIVEFVPPNDKHIESWIRPEHSWYTLDGFVSELRKSFSSVDVLDSFPSPRKLLVCHK